MTRIIIGVKGDREEDFKKEIRQHKIRIIETYRYYWGTVEFSIDNSKLRAVDIIEQAVNITVKNKKGIIILDANKLEYVKEETRK